MAEEQAASSSPFSRRPSAPPPVIRPATSPAATASAPRSVAMPPAPTTSSVQAQNLPMALLAGLAAAAAGAGLWALVTVVTGYQIGWMAIGVGFLVGLAVRLAGKGTTSTFQVLGAALALGGCLAGNVLTICIVAAGKMEISLTQMVFGLTPDFLLDTMSATFSPIDLLFYGLAVYAGYRYSVAGAAADA
jgi:hypothetical protein